MRRELRQSDAPSVMEGAGGNSIVKTTVWKVQSPVAIPLNQRCEYLRRRGGLSQILGKQLHRLLVVLWAICPSLFGPALRGGAPAM